MTNLVYIKQNKCWTNSKVLAEKFGKRHDNVLAKIEKQITEYSAGFVALNFKEYHEISELRDDGRAYKAYEITFDGFLAVAVTFTGKTAARFREAVIAEFNRRGEELQRRGLPTASVEELLQMSLDEIRKEKTAHEQTRLTSKIGSEDLCELEAAIKEKAAEFKTLGNAAYGLVRKCIKAKFTGGRASGTYKEISKKNFPESIPWTKSLTEKHLLAARGVKNSDDGLSVLSGMLEILDARVSGH